LVRKAGSGDFPLTLALVAPYVDRLLQLGDGQEVQTVRLDLEKLKVLTNDLAAEDAVPAYCAGGCLACTSS
jgi:hypothetical protein